jgi:hypothetical protein
MPSATVESPKVRPSSTKVCRRAVDASEPSMAEMNERSILSSSMGNRRRYVREDWPEPKSSMAILTPTSLSRQRWATVASASRIRTDSVTSRVTVPGSRRLAARASTTSLTRTGEATWRMETLTDIWRR